jgi:predicted O-methyltransferase YrrM
MSTSLSGSVSAARRFVLPAVLVAAIGLAALIAATRTAEDVAAESVRLAQVLDLGPAATVAEIGAGAGEMTVAMAERLGAKGRMYSTELDRDRVRDIREAVARAGMRNVTVLEAAERDTNLPAACCDAVFMRRVYHDLTEPAAIDTSLFLAVRSGGLVAVIDFPPHGGVPSRGVPANRTGHGVAAPLVVEELTRAGFEHLRTIDWTSGMFLALFRKPPARPSERRITDLRSGARPT